MLPRSFLLPHRVTMYLLLRKWSKCPSWKKIMISLLTGILTGFIFKQKAAYLQPIGVVFIHLIQMLVVPVVFTAIVCAVISIKEAHKMKRFFSKAVFIYACTMMVSATIGIVVANSMGVGTGLSTFDPVKISHAASSVDHLSFGSILVNFVPTSPVEAFATNNVIQVVLFAFLFGLALRVVGDKAKPVQDFFHSLSQVVFQFAKIVVGFAPYGVFALIASVIGKYGVSILLSLLKLVAAVYVGCAVLIICVYGVVLRLNGMNPMQFLKHVSDALITAFTTSSSAATLPVTMRCASENLKIDRNVSDFLLPLGATLNLNGLALYLSTTAIFAAHLFGMTLGMSQYVTLVITIVFAAAGAAAIPSSGLIVMSAVMSSVGIPLTAIPIIAGADRFNDMAQTMTNVAGDLFASALVAKSEKMIVLDEEPAADGIVEPSV